MKKRIIFATGNENKMKEIRMILADLGLEILSMKEAGVFEEIEEDGMSFEENAEIKARAVSRVLVNDIVLADDSGLEIDYLDKAPGIYSARFAGEDTSYDIKNRILLDRLAPMNASGFTATKKHGVCNLSRRKCPSASWSIAKKQKKTSSSR